MSSSDNPDNLGTSTGLPDPLAVESSSEKNVIMPSSAFDESTFRNKIPYNKGDKNYAFYESLIPVLRERKPSDRPRIAVFTDIELDYDDLLAIIFLSEMHRLGAVELVGFIANHGASLERAKFLRSVLLLLGLCHIEVAEGTNGVGDPDKLVEKHWLTGSYYELKNITFAQVWDNEPFRSGSALLEDLTREVDKGKEPLTVLLISSLQDISEYFNSKLGPLKVASDDADSKIARKKPEAVIEPGARVDTETENKGAKFLKTYFKRFISQGGYMVTTGNTLNSACKMEPLSNMANNNWNLDAAKNYTQCLAKYGLPSDAWSREVAKAATLDSCTITKQAGMGPIGTHLSWLFPRQEFKFYWDPFNAPFQPRLNKEWYLKTRLVLKSDTELFNELKNSPPSFREVLPMIKVIAYDGCAAMGAVGDDIMLALGIIGDNIPVYNMASHQHRIFGAGEGDLGGINGRRLGDAFEAFLCGALMATHHDAEQLIPSSSVRHEQQNYRVGLGIFEHQLPFLQQCMKLEDKAKQGDEMSRGQLAQLKSENLPGELGAYPKVPALQDIPYELLYQDAIQQVKAASLPAV